MQVVNSKGGESETPPVGCSSRNSIMEASGTHTSQPPATIGKEFLFFLFSDLFGLLSPLLLLKVIAIMIIVMIRM